MENANEIFLARMESLRKDYIEQFPVRIRSLQDSWTNYKSARGETKKESLIDLVRHAHSLKGSGATYGFATISKLASQLHTILTQVSERQIRPDSQENKQINILLDSLENFKFENKESYNFSPPAMAVTPTKDSKDLNQSLLLVMKDRQDAEYVVDQLQHYGYDITILNAIDSLSETIKNINPFAILMDISCQERFAAINKTDELDLPLIVVSEKDDIETRLQAVRTGAKHFLVKPVDTAILVDTLDSLISQHREEPNRILIVDDTKSLALYFETTLQSVGMQTCVVTDPMDVLNQLVEFSPELILLDMYMPGCEGQELAAVIRQHAAYDSVPIVYLSSETNRTKQLEAMRHGGDDFLTKPIDPNHLIKAVQTRTRRYRDLRSMMVRDSLTGLYNHTKTKELLEHDLYRCVRNKSPLIFGMIDIDKFKSVNDTYGHPVGDKVIKSLSRILKQRLRKSDIIGRYGGEEFAVILYDTNIEDASRFMNEIREHFALVSHTTDDKEFNVTFSCGLAAFPMFETASELNEAADKALYIAKKEGRNRIQIADLDCI